MVTNEAPLPPSFLKKTKNPTITGYRDKIRKDVGAASETANDIIVIGCISVKAR
jgi:hypothetical protein